MEQQSPTITKINILHVSQIRVMVLSKMNCCSKSGIPKVAPSGHSHVQIVLRVVMFSSADLPDERENCFRTVDCGWRHVLIVWPFCPFSFWTSLAVWFTECTGFPRSCFISKRFHCHSSFTSSFRFGKVHFSWFLFCSDRFLGGCVHQPAMVCILQSRLRTRRCVGFWISAHPANKLVHSYGYPQTFGCNPTLRGWGTCRSWEDKFVAVDFDFATLLSFPFCSCILFAIVWCISSSWNS